MRPCTPDEEKRSDDEDTNHISYPPRSPGRIIRCKSNDFSQKKTGHTNSCADHCTEGHGEKNQHKNVPETIKRKTKPIALEQISTYKGFKGISYAYAEGDKGWSTIEEVDQKGSQENSWPKTIAKKKKCRHGDPRRKPDERSKPTDGINGKAESGCGELDSKKSEYCC